MKLFRDLLCAGLAAIIALLTGEVLLRLTGLKYEASFFTPEPERAYALRPNAEGWQTTEGQYYVHINSAGMHDREHSLPRPAGTIRIAVIGSSEAEAKQLSPGENFASVLERTLNRKLEGSGRRVETLNFGVAGYNLAQIYLTLHNHVWQYDPQIVLLPYSNYLVLKNTPALSPEGLNKARFMTVRDGNIEPDASSRAEMARRPDTRRLRQRNRAADLMNRSQLICLANYALINLSHELSAWKSAWPMAGASSVQPSSPGLPSDYAAVWPALSPEDQSPRPDPTLVQASEVGDAIFRQMNREAGEHHSEFWLIVLDLPVQVHPVEARRSEFLKKNGMASLDRSERRLVAFCAANDIRAVALAPAILPSIPPGVAIRGFPGREAGDGHYNQTGHKLIGEYLAAKLYRDSSAFAHPAP